MSTTKFKQNLDITGDITLSGNINIGGGTIAGDADTDSVTFNADVTSHIIPDGNVTYDLGTSTKTWREVFTSKINSASGDDLDIHSGSDIALYPTGNIWIKQNTKLIFEGTLPDDFEAKLQATSVTADRDIILPDASGTLALTSDIPADVSDLTDTGGLLGGSNFVSMDYAQGGAAVTSTSYRFSTAISLPAGHTITGWSSNTTSMTVTWRDDFQGTPNTLGSGSYTNSSGSAVNVYAWCSTNSSEQRAVTYMIFG